MADGRVNGIIIQIFAGLEINVTQKIAIINDIHPWLFTGGGAGFLFFSGIKW